MKKIIVLFKTHLDVGFTDFSQKVIDDYINFYIPSAIKLAKEMHEKEERFIWTVGSWLLERYLKDSNDKNLLIDAINRGDVRWHGLPFTTHTELMSSELFQYGLSISKKLDAEFGVKTVAAKMTDVPGHTNAIIPYMAQAGIKFLHIGVNPASTRPNVPKLFRWLSQTGEEIVVMYNDNYGELTAIGESGVSVYFAHTGDNQGPQSIDQINEMYADLHEKYPGVKIEAGTLEDVAQVALKEELPVISSEIGDTWIHGVGTDPKKISQYRALLRLKDTLPEKEMYKIYDKILLIPEHTWGLDEKIHLGEQTDDGYSLGEHNYFIRSEFESIRSTAKFRKMEQSWEEQRNYINSAIDSLSGNSRLIAEQAIQQYKWSDTSFEGYIECASYQDILLQGYCISVNENGAVYKMVKNGRVIADSNHLLGSFIYEVFSRNEYLRFNKQYVISTEWWALEDFDKIGEEKAIDEYQSFVPKLAKVFTKNNMLLIEMTMPQVAVELYGGAEKLMMHITFHENKVEFDFAWFGKKANRIAEGLWLGFNPNEILTRIHKIDQWISPLEIVENGNKHMHAVDKGVEFGDIEITTLDTALVNIGKPSLLDFNNETPILTDGVYFNLFNNVWGTNFPMWYEDDARFRFVINL